MDSNTTNIAKDILIISTEDIQKNNAWLRKSTDTEKTSLNFQQKKIQNIDLRSILEKVIKFIETWMSY